MKELEPHNLTKENQLSHILEIDVGVQNMLMRMKNKRECVT